MGIGIEFSLYQENKHIMDTQDKCEVKKINLASAR